MRRTSNRTADGALGISKHETNSRFPAVHHGPVQLPVAAEPAVSEDEEGSTMVQ
jgi:hypothetical protein